MLRIHAAVGQSLPHPAELSRHVAEPVDSFVGVMLDDRQDFVILVFRHVQQLGDLVQLQVQLSDSEALWREGEESGDLLPLLKTMETHAWSWWWRCRCLTCQQGSVANLTLALKLPALRGLFAKVPTQLSVLQEMGELFPPYSEQNMLRIERSSLSNGIFTSTALLPFFFSSCTVSEMPSKTCVTTAPNSSSTLFPKS